MISVCPRHCRLPFLLIITTISSIHVAKSSKNYKDRFKRQQGANLYLPESYVTDGGDDQPTNGPWSDWSAPSPCSRTCGGGVSMQYRQCQGICQGPDRRYFSCNTQDCPDTGDFRAQQCSAYDDVPFESVRYQWVPYIKSLNPCELNCMPKGQRFYYRHAEKVTDGTRCNQNSLDVCIDGKCWPVGCDMMLGSNMKEDECRVCGGDGKTCNTITNTLNLDDLQVGYNDILLIPAGATNILVEEISPSNNYLAIRNTTGHYYLNGNWRIDFPRSLDFAGSAFRYDRFPQGLAAPDKVSALGPIEEAIFIVLLYQDTVVPIRYKYSLPTDVQPGSEWESYAWAFDEFTPCSATCGGGIQYRNVSCSGRKTLTLAEEKLCDQSRKPESSRQCNQVPCEAQWVPLPWSNCSVPCQDDTEKDANSTGGVQTRSILCQQTQADGRVILLDESQCHSPKPPDEQPCNYEKGKPCPKWFKNPWKPCDHLCGKGKQTRQIYCYIKDKENQIQLLPENECETISAKPESEKECSLRPCEGLDWITSAWSGCDPTMCGLTNETRKVFCATSSGQIYSNDLCDASKKPETIRKCEEEKTAVCDYLWYSSQWSQCSATCGIGIQTRTIFCGLSTSSGVKRVADEKCNQSKSFDTIQNCTATKECDGEWFSGPWGECSKECGGGERKKKVVCIKNNNVIDISHCNAEEIIFTSEKCNIHTCGPEFSTTEASPERSELKSSTEFDLSENVTNEEGSSTTEVTALTVSTEFETIENITIDASESALSETPEKISKPKEQIDEEYEIVPADSCDDGEWVDVGVVPVEPTTLSPITDRSSDITDSVSTSLSISTAFGVETTTNLIDGSGTTESESDKLFSTISKIASAISDSWSTISDQIFSDTSATIDLEATSGSSIITSLITSNTESTDSTVGSTQETTESHTTFETTTEFNTENSTSDVTETDLTSLSTTETSETVTVTIISTETTVKLENSSTTVTDVITTTPSISDINEEPDESNLPSPKQRVQFETSTNIATTDTESNSNTYGETSSSTDSSDTESTVTNSDASTDGTTTTTISSDFSSNSISSIDDNTGSTSIATETDISSTETTDFSTSITTESETLSSSSSTTHISEIFKKKKKMCKRIKIMKCQFSEYGCCWDKIHEAKGPFGQGCPAPEVCTESSYGCCPNGVSAALGPKNRGCPTELCNETLFGCCWDNKTTAAGSDQENCPPIPKLKGVSLPSEELELSTLTTEYTTETAVTDNIPTYSCSATSYGCCADNRSPSHGRNNEGCCLNQPFGCCPDDITPALGINDQGCNCRSSTFGCCPDNTTFARGYRLEGCGCKYTQHGCCPDDLTEASGPNFEGCPCNTYQFGCCPDGITIAIGPRQQGCHCSTTTYGCCPDNQTPANGPNMAGCEGCITSTYGCCLDGVTEAKGDNFEGCEDPQSSCWHPKERGPCRNYTVKWYFDTNYGGCTRFWYGGCQGNGNRYNSKEECESICVAPQGQDRCRLPMVQGSCQGYYPQWHYDKQTKQCSQFIYGGCLGNNNKFDTRQECTTVCGPHATAAADPCQYPVDKGPCQNQYRRYFYDSSLDDCVTFAYGGCKGNPNNFVSLEACKQKCSKPGTKRDYCLLPKVEGSNCIAREAKWYFNSRQNRCMPFYFTGCDGESNKNQFDSRELCMEHCPVEVVQDTCHLPADIGSCGNYVTKWYYDTKDKRCRQFYYGGCDGNGNRFDSNEECDISCNAQNLEHTPSPEQIRPPPHYTSPPRTEVATPRPYVDVSCQLKFEECSTLKCPYGIEAYVDENDCNGCRCTDPCQHFNDCPDGSQCAIDFNRNKTKSTDADFIAVCREINKPGHCPRIVSANVQTDGQCRTECHSDADCTLYLKCCQIENCDRVCLEPEEYQRPSQRSLEIPYTIPMTTFAPEYAPQIDVRVYKPDVTAILGSEVILNCAVHGNPNPSIMWSKNGAIINGKQPRYRIRLDQTLQIITLHKTDSGIYLCTADNKIGRPIQNQIALQVQDSPVPVSILNSRDPELDNRVVVTTFNSQATLNCFALGNPYPAVTWWKDDELIPLKNREYEVTQDDYSLVIHSVRLKHLGVYTCQAYNGLGQASSWSVTIKAKGPYYSNDPADDIKYLRYVINSRDNKENNRPETITDSPDHRISDSPIRTFEQPPLFDNSILGSDNDISSGLHENESPGNGSIDNNYQTNVLLPEAAGHNNPPSNNNYYLVPLQVNVTAQKTEYVSGEEFEILCNIYNSDSPTRTTWYKDGIKINNDMRISISADGTKLSVKSSDQLDSGRYQCIAENSHSKVSDSLNIIIKNEIVFPPNCTDNQFFANCKLIVKARFCSHRYYAKFCCRSCTEDGQL